MKSYTQYFLFLLLMPLIIITVGCDASNLAVPPATFLPDMQFLTSTAMSSSMPNELLTQTSPPIPTLDSSTPAPPNAEWMTYTYPSSGLSFKYPTNWFIVLEEEQHRVVILNVPPGGIRAIKGAEGGDPELVKIIVYLKSTAIPRLQTLETYVNETIQQSNWADEIISVETIPALRQGYPAVRVIALGLGERTHYFVENNGHVMQVISDYLPDRRAELASVVEEVANTLVFP